MFFFILAGKLEYNVTRAYMGSFMTSLEMAGVSLTLLKMTDRWAECLGNLILFYTLFKARDCTLFC